MMTTLTPFSDAKFLEAELLKAARELISLPSNWTKGCDARDIDGKNTYSADPKAVQWCALGAIARVRSETICDPYAYERLRRALPAPWDGVGAFNDSPLTSHSDIISLFNRAIKECKDGN